MIAALAPLVWSVSGLASPGRGAVWGRRLGTRRPSAGEWEQVEDAIQVLGFAGRPSLDIATCRILDDPIPHAAVRGRVVVLTRALLESESLPSVLAHELGHLGSLDGRLTEALARFELWTVRRSTPESQEPDPRCRPGLTGCLARAVVFLAAGGCAERALASLWAAYWRAREYAADAHAASLGQAEDLARHLAEFELPFDRPRSRLLFDRSEHPPIAHRIERLLVAGGGRPVPDPRLACHERS